MQINNDKNITATERLLQYIDYMGISKYMFHKKLGLSNGFLDKPRGIGSDKCANIIEQYPDISLKWLITGQGHMLGSELDKDERKEFANCKKELEKYMQFMHDKLAYINKLEGKLEEAQESHARIVELFSGELKAVITELQELKAGTKS